jgi:DNA repair protein RecO (recombination protein O)
MLYYVDVNSISKLDISDEVIKEISMFLDDYYDRYTGIYVKSKDFIRKINMLK